MNRETVFRITAVYSANRLPLAPIFYRTYDFFNLEPLQFASLAQTEETNSTIRWRILASGKRPNPP